MILKIETDTEKLFFLVHWYMQDVVMKKKNVKEMDCARVIISIYSSANL